MMQFLTRYHPRYVRSLVYMLQASEYDADDFLRWNARVRDFRRVEKRGRLKYTAKARVLAAFAWFAIAVVVLVIVVGISPTAGDIPHLVALIFFLFFPLMLPYLLASSTRLLNLLQTSPERLIIRRAARKLEGHPGYRIAIAGSYGKTSMREILRTVLGEGKRVASPGGSHNTPLAIARFIEGLKGDEEVLIFEFGEYYPGDVRQLAEMVRPQMGIITGVNEAHLDKFRTLEKARDTIFELADYIGDGPLYINGESGSVQARLRARNRLYSREGLADLRVAAPETSLDGTSFTLERAPIRIKAQSKLLGLHQIGPLSAAAHVALLLKLDVNTVERGIAKTKPFAHRLERKDDAGGVVTLDDSYNGNPDGVRAAIEFLAGIEGRRRWYVTPGLVEMGAQSEEIHKEIGKQLAEAGIEKIVLIKNSVTPWIEKGLREAIYGGDVMWFDDALKCYEQLPYMTVLGDVVLLQNDWPDQYA